MLNACLWLSVAITLAHTVDEVWADGGPIWKYLSELTPIGSSLWLPAYICFQWLVIAAAFFAYQGNWCWPLLAVRIADFSFTHQVLASVHAPNPGSRTRLLLLLDVVVLLAFQVINP